MKYLVQVNGEDVEVDIDADEVRCGDLHTTATVSELEGTPVRMVRIGDTVHRVVMRRGDGRGRYTLWLDGFRYEVEALDERTRVIRELSGASAAATGPAPLKAPMPGMIVRIAVNVGDTVRAGDSLVVMEAMKMENELRASAPGTVKAIHAVVGQPVDKGTLLLELE